MIRPRDADRSSEASRQLCAIIDRDQRLNIQLLIPALFAFNLLSVVVLKMEPEFFLRRQGHAYLAAGQAIGLLAYLRYVVRFFGRLAPVIAQRQEERKSLADNQDG